MPLAALSRARTHPHTHFQRPLPSTTTMSTNGNNKGRSTPRVVCCAIPISRTAGKILVITSRKRPDNWVCESCVSLQCSTTRLHPFRFVFVVVKRSADVFPLSTLRAHDLPQTHPRPTRTHTSAKRRMGALRRGARSSSLERSLGRRSHHLSLTCPPILTRFPPPFTALPVPYIFPVPLQPVCAAQ